MKWQLIIILILVSGIAYARPFGQGEFGLGLFNVGQPITPAPKSSGGGGGGYFYTINSTQNLSANMSCSAGYQKFDNLCYPCDNKTGYLKFNDDRSITCIVCPTNYFLNGTTCIASNQTLANKVSDSSSFLLILIVSIFAYHIYSKEKKRKNQENSF